jgi:iron complex transport system permease protein
MTAPSRGVWGVGIGLLGAIWLSISIGEMGWLGPGDLLRCLGMRFGGSAAGLEEKLVVLWELRLPRTLLGVLAGASLGVSGALMQSFFRNPVAEPYVTGVSSGAAFAAVGVLMLGGSMGQVSLAAFLGASLSAWLVYRLATRQGTSSPLLLILGGMAVAGFLQALTLAMLLRVDAYGMRAVMNWLMGSLAYRGWDHVIIAAAGLIPGLALAWGAARVLDLLSTGDDAAASLGVPVDLTRRVILVAACLLAGTAVAACGIIAYAGLMSPHLARMLVGARHRVVLPLSALTGAALLTWADVLARQLAPGQELPVGVITGVIGAAFLLVMVLRQGRVAPD